MSGKMETTVSIAGEVDASIKKAIDSVNDEIEKLAEVAADAAPEIERMANEIKEQEAALKTAKKQYASYLLEGADAAEQAQKLAGEIKDLSDNLKRNKSAFAAAEKAADRLCDDLDDTGDSAGGAEKEVKDLEETSKESKEGFTIMRGAIAGLIANGLTKLVSSAVDAAKSVYQLADSTREYRADMGKLDSAFETAGHTASTATATYDALIGVIGETDQSVEAAQQIALLADSEKDAAQWADLAAGVVGRFGDALQPETFYESANETLKLGEATGTYVQMIEGVGGSVEEFNDGLAACTTEAEKQAYMLEYTDNVLGAAADSYRESNASIIEANKANAAYTDTVAEMGARIEPITTAVQGGMTGILESALGLMDEATLAEFAEGITDAFAEMAPVISQLIEDAMPFLTEFLGGVKDIIPKILPVISQLASSLEPLLQFIADVLPIIFDVIGAILPLVANLLESVLPVLISMLESLLPIFQQLVEALLPVILSIVEALLPIVQMLFEEVLLPILENFIMPLMEPLMNLVEAILPVLSPILEVISAILTPLAPVLEVIGEVLGWIVDAIATVVGWIADGFQWLVELIFGEPEYVDEVNSYATGGFTDGVSIAGEDPRYPTEAVISFNPAYRKQNLSYWAKAGRMLGASADDFYISSGSSSHVDFGGISFSPQITINGNADKNTVMEAIEEEYPEFMDMLEELLARRERTVYA